MPTRPVKRKDKAAPEVSGHCSVCFSAVRTADAVNSRDGAVHHLSCWRLRTLSAPHPRAA